MRSYHAPPLFVISLAREHARRRLITQRADSAGIDIEIIEAVDGLDSQFEHFAKELHAHGNTARWSRSLSLGEIACTASHRLCFEAIINRDLDGAFIVEDDVSFASDFALFRSSFEEFTHLLRDQSCIIYLGEWGFDQRYPKCSVKWGLLRDSNDRTIELGEVARFRGNLFGSYGYYASRQAAINILAREASHQYPADAWKQRLQDSTLDAILLSRGHLVLHDHTLQSTIEGDRSTIIKQITPEYTLLTRKIIFWIKRLTDFALTIFYDPVIKLFPSKILMPKN